MTRRTETTAIRKTARHRQRRAARTVCLATWGIVLSLGCLSAARAEDWPTFRHDNRRSGITSETLHFPLTLAWTRSSPTPPQTAWTGPAKWDAYANIRGLESMRNFDPAPFVTAVGSSVYFGSSVDDAVHCLDAGSGQEKWVFRTEGPVRLPPTWHEGRVYFGSDDGHAYCLDAETGSLIWKRKPADEHTLMLSNGKMISHWPCRTGVLVEDGKAYFGASLLPWEPSYLCAVDPATGSDRGPGLYSAVHEQLTMQGAMLATPSRLYIPQGRQRPEMFNRTTGQSVGGLGKSGEGGVYALITKDDKFVHGRGQNHGALGELRGFDARTRDYLVTFPSATGIVVTDAVAYLNLGNELGAFDRLRYFELGMQQTELLGRQQQIKGQLKQLEKQGPAEQIEKLHAELEPIEAELATLPARMSECFLWRIDAAYPP